MTFRAPAAAAAGLDPCEALTVDSQPCTDYGCTASTMREVYHCVVTGLSPCTEVTYALEDGRANEIMSGRVRTFPAADSALPCPASVTASSRAHAREFRLGFGACAVTGSDAAVWGRMEEEDLDLFVHMGDLHYEDVNFGPPEEYGRAFERVVS